MNKWLARLGATIVVLSAVAYVAAGGTAVKPEKGMVIGEVIDIAGYMMRGAQGEKDIEAGQFRAEQGFPVGIIEEETGDVYVAVYKYPAPATALQTANAVLAPLMGKKVTAQGLKYRSEKMNVIRISTIVEY